MVANVVSALSNVQGLSGDLLSTIMSDVASALSAANGLTGSVLPSNGAFALVSHAGTVGGDIVSNLGEVVASAGIGVTSIGNVFATVTGAPVAVAGPEGDAAGNVVPTLAGVAASAGNGIASAGNAITGNVVAVAGNNILGRLETVVNGAPTLLDIVTTVLNGKPTIVPVADMMVNGVSTQLPVVNDAADLLAGLNGGSGIEIAKGRRRVAKRGETAPLEVAYFCEKNPDDEPCVLCGDGGELLMEKDDQAE